MANSIFRKNTVDKMISPDDLNRYIKVANPSVWVLLIALALVLAGGILWCIFGKIESRVPGVLCAADGTCVCYVSEAKTDSLAPGSTLEADGLSLVLGEELSIPLPAADLSGYAFHLGGFTDGEYVRVYAVSGSLDDGTYSCEVITEQISPFAFLWN